VASPAAPERPPSGGPRQARDVMAFGQEVGRALSDGRIVGRAEPFAKVFASSRVVKRAVGLVAWGVLEDIALDAQLDERGRLVAETSIRAIAGHLALSKNTVTKHLARLREYGFVLHEERRDDGSGRWETCRYVLDPSACVERFTATPKPPCPKNWDTGATVSQSTGHRDLGRKEQEVVVASEEQQQAPVVAQLTSLGVAGDIAAELAASHPAEDIERVVAAASRRNLRSPAGWVVRALREGWDVAAASASSDAGARERLLAQQAADRVAAEQAEEAARACAAGWATAISAALDDRQLCQAVERVTTAAAGIGRRSVPLARAQLVAWAVAVTRRARDVPLAEALAADLTAGATPPVSAGEARLPSPPPCPTTPTDLCERLRACLSRPTEPQETRA